MLIAATTVALGLTLQSTSDASSILLEDSSLTVEELENRRYNYLEYLHYDGTTGYSVYDFEVTNSSDEDILLDRAVRVCITDGERHMEEVPGVVPVYAVIPAGETLVLTIGCETNDIEGDIEFPW